MHYKTLRILLAFISSAIFMISALAVVVLLITQFNNGLIIVSAVLPLGIIVFVCAYAATGFYLGPIGKVMLRVKQLADGQHSVRFMDEGMLRTPLGVQELATELDLVASKMRSQLAEAAIETNRQNQFVSDVSHELRTPLTAIRGAAETMMDEDISYEDRRLFCESIVRESERLTRLANDLLTLQRIDGGGEIILERVNLHKVIEYAANMLGPLLEARNVELSIKGEAPDVLGDTDRLQQVSVNLIENASRFTDPERGRIWVELSGIKGHTVLTVKDNGKGFGDIDPVRLFDRFYRGDVSRARTSGGTGLGLTIVKAIVNSLDGTVEAVNLPDGGACFIVAIPSLPPRSE
ncbi:MAG: HAMP domain-containing histidine kinase [Coriobacteriales bacterium]|nr:HAMP domain-containing histidine kinase [Coriobacteriales bacterium]